MLYLWGFQKVGVVLSDLYFVDPDPGEGQEGPERGVRLEVRLLAQGTHDGTIYAARPISVDRPVWRADLLESVDSAPGSFDRTHHHPAMRGWEPGGRSFDEELSADPVGFLERALADLPGLLARAELGPADVGPDDARQLRQAVPEILDTLRRLLDRVAEGELARAPETAADAARLSWL